MNKYKEGDVVKARITAVERYGAFAAIDDEYSGLIHISEFTDKFVKNINDYVGIGDIINVKILNCDGKSNQLRLSAKDVNPNLYKNKKNKIKETVFGFYLLKSALPGWIDKKWKRLTKILKTYLTIIKNTDIFIYVLTYVNLDA